MKRNTVVFIPYIKGWGLLGVASLMVGCVNPIKSHDDVEMGQDSIKFAEEYINSSISPGPFFIDTQRSTEEKEIEDVVTTYQRSWCSRVSSNRVMEDFSIHCRLKGGELRDGWCARGSDDVPIYKLTLFNSESCNMAIDIIQPHSDVSLDDFRWKKIAKDRGFKSKSTLLEMSKIADEKRKIAAEKRRQEESYRRDKKMKEDAFMLSDKARGTKVCSVASSYRGERSYGYIEDHANGKIKVSVFNYGGDNWTVSGFTPHITWSLPSKWFVC